MTPARPARAGGAQVLAGEALPLPVGREELAHLGPRARAFGCPVRQPADELEEAEVARRDTSWRPEAVQREHLDRPGADVGDRRSRRAAARARRSAHRGLEVGAAGGHLARRPAQRERALGREVEGHQPRRRRRRRPPRRRARRAARSPGSARPSTAIMRRWIATARSNSISCSVTAGEQRLPRLRPAADPQVRVRAHGRPITGSSRKRSWNGRRSSSTPVAKRMRAMPSAAAASVRGARGEQHAVGAPAARRRRARARRRGAAAAAATRRGGASGRRPTRRRAGTATAARPRPGARRRPASAPARALNRGAAGGRRPGRSCEATISPSPFLALLALAPRRRGRGDGAPRRPWRPRPRSRWRPARPPGGRAPARAAQTRRPRRAAGDRQPVDDLVFLAGSPQASRLTNATA